MPKSQPNNRPDCSECYFSSSSFSLFCFVFVVVFWFLHFPLLKLSAESKKRSDSFNWIFLHHSPHRTKIGRWSTKNIAHQVVFKYFLLWLSFSHQTRLPLADSQLHQINKKRNEAKISLNVNRLYMYGWLGTAILIKNWKEFARTVIRVFFHTQFFSFFFRLFHLSSFNKCENYSSWKPRRKKKLRDESSEKRKININYSYFSDACLSSKCKNRLIYRTLIWHCHSFRCVRVSSEQSRFFACW